MNKNPTFTPKVKVACEDSYATPTATVLSRPLFMIRSTL